MPPGQPGGQPVQAGASQQASESPEAAAEGAGEQQVQREGAAAAAAAAAADGGSASMGSKAGDSKSDPRSSGGDDGGPAAEDSAAASVQAEGSPPAATAAAAEPEASAGSPPAARPAAHVDAAPCTIMALPDHVIGHIFQSVDQAERLTSVVLVCKRFAALSLCADERRVTLNISGARAVERARQLLLWLPRNAPRIKFLGMDMAAPAAQPEGGQGAGAANPADEAEIDNITACCLVAFGVLGGGQLEQLTVEPGTVLSTTAWLPTLRRLQRLQLGGPGTQLLLTGPLHLLTEADDFELTGAPIKFGPGVQLPPSLWFLHLKDRVSVAMPPQVTELTNLHDLKLKCPRYSGDSMAGLTSLPSLTSLVMNCCSSAPAGLAGMTQLGRLEISTCTSAQPVPGLAAVLTSLTGLFDLWIGGDYASVLPALTALGQLEKLGFLLYTHEPPEAAEGDGAEPAAAAAPAAAAGAAPEAAGVAAQAAAGEALQAAALPSLPIGPYLSGLAELDVNWHLVANSLPALQQASALEYLGVNDMPTPEAAPKENWDAAFNWLARHPPLQELGLKLAEDEQFGFVTFDALMRLKDRRPALKVARGQSSWIDCD